ncbi:MAG: SDR family NAD(P)-dependent oxidoreductase [Chloroflexota bacterium]|nr:SDR family NAD(P)-dependent oxidoreductase [Chloroflexota bacterium]MDE2950103.1 SDR family NAD(P)-dependent oxidoreductase [Chloroflexota bacterium]
MLGGKTAIVTGAAGDLGNAMARQLAERGAHVVMWDIVPRAEAAHAVAGVRAHDAAAEYAEVDVRDRAAVDEAIAHLEQLDIVCSNAGIVEAQPFLELSGDNWQNHLDINLTGCFNVCQSAARRMVADGTKGRLILTSSWVGSIPWPEITAYTVSKAGVNMLVKQMARELAARGILVNAVAPGIVDAGLAGRQLREEPQYAARVAKAIPLGEPGSPEEIAAAVVYLASPQTAYMTGSILTLDGGCSLFQFDA